MQQQQQQQQQKQKKSRSVADRLAGAVRDEASALAKKAKKFVSNAPEEEEATQRDSELQGNCFAQSVSCHDALQRLSGPRIGRELCSKCHTQGSAYLRWDISELCKRKRPTPLSTYEQARLLTNAFNPMPAGIQWLYDMAAAGQPLGFPADDAAYETVNLATEFLMDLCDNILAEQLPLLFSGATVLPVGAWAHEAALACADASLDFIISLPAWISTNKLCACDFVGLSGTVVLRKRERVPFETQLHQSVISTLERLVAGAAVAKLQQMEIEGSALRLDYDKGVSYNPGADSQYVWAPKKVVLNVICSTPSGGERRCNLRLTFGVPCQLVSQIKPGSSSQEELELCGHLLFGLSEPLMLSVSLEEKKRLLSGAETSNHPRLRLLRMIKFLLQVGEQLSLLRSEITKSDQTLSFIANSVVRDTQQRYEMTEEAYYKANFGDRLVEIIDALCENPNTVPFFSVDCSFTRLTKRKLPSTTRQLLLYLKRPPEEQKDASHLMELLLQVFSRNSEKMKKAARGIERILEGPG